MSLFIFTLHHVTLWFNINSGNVLKYVCSSSEAKNACLTAAYVNVNGPNVKKRGSFRETLSASSGSHVG